VVVSNRQVDAEAVPASAAVVFEVTLEPPAQVAGQADVVQLVPAIERVDAVPPPDVITDDVLILLQRLARDGFEVLLRKSCRFNRRLRSFQPQRGDRF
jgi:hypothetical protein